MEWFFWNSLGVGGFFLLGRVLGLLVEVLVPGSGLLGGGCPQFFEGEF